MYKVQFVLVVFIVLLTSACSSGGSDGAPSSIPQNTGNLVPAGQSGLEQPTVFVPPTDAATLQNALHTRYVSANDFDVWQCAQSGSSTPIVAYSLPAAGTLGEGLTGKEYALSTGGETLFVWQTMSGSAVTTMIVVGGASVDSTNYQFSSANNFSYNFNGTGLNCVRVSNTVAFGGTPATGTMTSTEMSLPTSPATELQGLTSVWYTSDVDAKGTVNRTYLAFNDGTATHDPEYLEIGRTRSQTENPGYWKRYFLEEDDIVLIGSSGGESRPFLSTRLSPGAANQRYDGCWEADDANTIIPDSNFAIFRSVNVCFSSDGRYASSNNTINVVDTIASASNSSDNGTYQIDGHLLTLQGDNGEASNSIFGWYQFASDQFPRLVIGKNVYQRQ